MINMKLFINYKPIKVSYKNIVFFFSITLFDNKTKIIKKVDKSVYYTCFLIPKSLYLK